MKIWKSTRRCLCRRVWRIVTWFTEIREHEILSGCRSRTTQHEGGSDLPLTENLPRRSYEDDSSPLDKRPRDPLHVHVTAISVVDSISAHMTVTVQQAIKRHLTITSFAPSGVCSILNLSRRSWRGARWNSERVERRVFSFFPPFFFIISLSFLFQTGDENEHSYVDSGITFRVYVYIYICVCIYTYMYI